MLHNKHLNFFIRIRCLPSQQIRPAISHVISSNRHYSTPPPPEGDSTVQTNVEGGSENYAGELVTRGGGRMSSRLAQMTDESLRQGRSAEKAINEAGFSEDLKRQLEEKIKESAFKSENPAAFAHLNMPSIAGQGTRNIAAAQPWTGSESVEDAALRMLTDAHKPLRGARPARIPIPKGAPMSVDMRMKKAVQGSQGQRLANARDRTSVYALSQDPNLTEHEKEQMRKQLQERFSPGARPMPGTVQGLTALANERIEEAMARGQFKNIARGKGKNIDRDYTASSPFLDTTEYFMNKIIQKQEIVPPWIEKQQELVKAAHTFRSRLRADWKRHAARMIASKGGSLEAQIQRARAYAVAEAATNPKAMKPKPTTSISDEETLSQAKVPSSPSSSFSSSPLQDPNPTSQSPPSTSPSPPSPSPPPQPSPPHPFRDPSWESLERPYHTLSILTLNNLTRSYNLQAPTLAQKPYFSLSRELQSCFADIAPLLPAEIQTRATRPTKSDITTGRNMGMLERWQGGGGVQVRESTKPKYGFKELWRDFWGREVK